MKINTTKNSKLGMAMSEYLIVLAVVALGCICIFGLFGRQVKATAEKAIATLDGKSAPDDQGVVAAAAASAGKKTDLSTFTGAGN